MSESYAGKINRKLLKKRRIINAAAGREPVYPAEQPGVRLHGGGPESAGQRGQNRDARSGAIQALAYTAVKTHAAVQSCAGCPAPGPEASPRLPRPIPLLYPSPDSPPALPEVCPIPGPEGGPAAGAV